MWTWIFTGGTDMDLGFYWWTQTRRIVLVNFDFNLDCSGIVKLGLDVFIGVQSPGQGL